MNRPITPQFVPPIRQTPPLPVGSYVSKSHQAKTLPTTIPDVNPSSPLLPWTPPKRFSSVIFDCLNAYYHPSNPYNPHFKIPIEAPLAVEELKTYAKYNARSGVPHHWTQIVAWAKLGISCGALSQQIGAEHIDTFLAGVSSTQASGQRSQRQALVDSLQSALENGLNEPLNLIQLCQTIKQAPESLTSHHAIAFLHFGFNLTRVFSFSDISAHATAVLQETLRTFTNQYPEIQDDEEVEMVYADPFSLHKNRYGAMAKELLNEIEFYREAPLAIPSKQSPLDRLQALEVLAEIDPTEEALWSAEMQKTAQRYGDEFDRVYAAISLRHLGHLDASDDLLIEGLYAEAQEHESHLQGKVINLQTGEPIPSIYWPAVVNNNYMATLAVFDQSLAWHHVSDILTAHPIQTGDPDYEPIRWRPEDQNFFQILARIFTPPYVENLAYQVLFSEDASAAWQLEAVTYFTDELDHPEPRRVLSVYLSIKAQEALTESSTYQVVQEIIIAFNNRMAEKKAQKAQGEKLILLKKESEFDYFEAFLPLTSNPYEIIRLAQYALINQSHWMLRRQALRFLKRQARPTDWQPLMIEALEFATDPALKDRLMLTHWEELFDRASQRTEKSEQEQFLIYVYKLDRHLKTHESSIADQEALRYIRSKLAPWL